MPADLLIRGGLLVTPAGLWRGDVAVEGGIVTQVAPEVSAGAREVLDARGLHVMPGLIDVHVHFNEPGRSSWEGLASGSAALAAGGGTTFCDMPLNSHPPLLTPADFHDKCEAAAKASITDFALWGALTPKNLQLLPDLAECGVVGFKAFMCDSGIPEFETADDLTLLEGMQVAAELGLPVAVHAESEALTAALTHRARTWGGRSAGDVLESRPSISELEAVQRALLFAQETRCDLHFVHLSCHKAVELIKEARARGVSVTCETCPHYLHFNAKDFERLGATLKCAPPLRSEEERRALWRAVTAGDVDLIASDHSPCPPEMKDEADMFAAWGGVNGVQSTLNVLLEHRLDVGKIAHLTAHRPADRFRLTRKGPIQPGTDADLALIDLSKRTALTNQSLLTRHQTSPYLGEALAGRVVRTLVRGRTVFKDGKVAASPCGRLVRPARREH